MKNKQLIIKSFRNNFISQCLHHVSNVSSEAGRDTYPHPVREAGSVEETWRTTYPNTVSDAKMLFNVALLRYVRVVLERFSTEIISITGYASRKINITSC